MNDEQGAFIVHRSSFIVCLKLARVQIDLSNKVALITGASRGIGRQTAIGMAEAGAREVVNYHRSEAQAQEVVRQIGNGATAMRADVSDPRQLQSMIEQIGPSRLPRFGHSWRERHGV